LQQQQQFQQQFQKQYQQDLLFKERDRVQDCETIIGRQMEKMEIKNH